MKYAYAKVLFLTPIVLLLSNTLAWSTHLARATKPKIGVVGMLLDYKVREGAYGSYKFAAVEKRYVDAIVKAGGEPWILPPLGNASDMIPSYASQLDGLLLQGGHDLPPSAYGAVKHPSVKSVTSNERFFFEQNLLTHWLEKTDKPLLGICYGCQAMNVAGGGTLIQDIPSQLGKAIDHSAGPVHRASILPGSRLHRILQKQEVDVNSFHHQSIDELAPGYVVTARSPDGVIEAIERPGDRFVMGVQWHAEREHGHLDVVRDFVQEAAKTAERRQQNLMPHPSPFAQQQGLFPITAAEGF